MYTYWDLNMLISCILYLFVVLSRCLGIPRPECCRLVPVFAHKIFTTIWELTRKCGFLNACHAYYEQNSYHILLLEFFIFNFILIHKCFFSTFQIHFGCCTVDILKQISGEEISRKPPGGKPGDRIGWLATHILKQQRWLHLFMQLINRGEFYL